MTPFLPTGQAALEAESLAAHIATLEVADEARARHLFHTVGRDLGLRSAGELRARGIDVHDRSDHVTAQEWLDAHRAAQDDDDQRRHVDDRDVHDAHTRREVDDLSPVDDRAGETALPDIRDTSTPDPGEHTDPPRRSMRPPDQTAALLDRAGEAIAEIRNRLTADQARTAAEHAESARSQTLARWADDDRAAEQEAHSQETEPVLER